MMKVNILKTKSYSFAIRIINLYKYILSKQVLRSGTAVGALVAESEFAQSMADFVSKLSISLKEANETLHWLSLLKDSDYMSVNMYQNIKLDIDELIKLLVSSIKTCKKENEK